MNFTKQQIEMIRYLADERKLEVKVYNYKGVRSVELHEKSGYTLGDKFNLIVADKVKTLKECKQVASNFLNWLDEFGGNYGYNIKTDYVTL
jgi:hypothetical protein